MTQFRAVRTAKIKNISMEYSIKNLRFAVLVVALALLLPLAAGAQWAPLNPVTGVERQADGVLLSMQAGVLRVEVCAGAIIHVTYAPGASIPDVAQFIVTKTSWPPVQWKMDSTDAAIMLITPSVKVVVTRKNGAIRYEDSTGKKLFEDGGRSLTPVEVNGEKPSL